LPTSGPVSDRQAGKQEDRFVGETSDRDAGIDRPRPLHPPNRSPARFPTGCFASGRGIPLVESLALSASNVGFGLMDYGCNAGIASHYRDESRKMYTGFSAVIIDTRDARFRGFPFCSCDDRLARRQRVRLRVPRASRVVKRRQFETSLGDFCAKPRANVARTQHCV